MAISLHEAATRKWKTVSQSNPIQNIAERNQVIITEEEIKSALKFPKRNKLQGQTVHQQNYSNMEEKT
jgi:hypothetical protein